MIVSFNIHNFINKPQYYMIGSILIKIPYHFVLVLFFLSYNPIIKLKQFILRIFNIENNLFYCCY